MNSLGIKLETSDPIRLGPKVIEGMKELFPFRHARFLPCQKEEDILTVLHGISMSARQMERAEKKILREDGFWDRIGQKAVIPLLSGGTDSCLGLFEFSGVPKDIAPGEAARTLRFLKALLKDRLFLAKISRTISTDDQPPAYVEDLLKENGNSSLHLIQMSFHKKGLTLKNGERFVKDAFPGSRMEFAGRSCSTLWFAVYQKERKLFSDGARRLIWLLSRARQPFRAVLAHMLHRGPEEAVHFQHVAKGLNTSILTPSILEEILLKTGADLKGGIFKSGQITPGPRSCCIMASLESLAAGKRVRDLFNAGGYGCQVLEAGSRCLLLHFRNPGFQKANAGLDSWAADIFDKISAAAGSRVTAGFACAAQPFVSAVFLPYSALLALFHAHLLGKGRMAVFNHVTLNVQGDLLVSWGDIRGACRAYRKGLKLEPRDTNLLNSLGVCLADLRRLKEARRCFRQVLASTPDNFMALYNLAGINMDTGNLKDAERQAQKVYAMDPHSPAVLLRLAGCWMKQKRFKRLTEVLRPEISENPSPPFALLRIYGQAAIETGDWNRAKDILGRCLKMKKNDPLCLALLAKGYSLFEQDGETASRFLHKIPKDAGQLGEVKKIIRDLKKRHP